MANSATMYSIGEMVVHRYYGIGQIDDIEIKPIKGNNVECYKVRTKNGTYWFPTEGEENPRVHPVASQKVIKEAIEILQSAPNNLEIDPRQWKERVDDVLDDGSITAISGLVRDLTALKSQQRLNRTQDQALNQLKDRLLREWAASLNVDASTIRPKLNAYLKESRANAAG